MIPYDTNAACKSCGARIAWAKHERTGKAAPIELEPRDDGPCVLLPDGRYRVLTQAQREEPITEPRRYNHFQTCPAAANYRAFHPNASDGAEGVAVAVVSEADKPDRIHADEVVGVVGSRSFSDPGRVRQWVNRLPPRVILVTGTAAGPETVAFERATEVGIRVRVHAPDAERCGSKAGAEQKRAIVGDLVAHNGRLVAFVAVDAETNELSKGTMATVHMAREAGLKVNLYRDLEETAEPDVPPRIAELVARADDVAGRYRAERIAQARASIRTVIAERRGELYAEKIDLEQKLEAGSAWLDGHPDHERYAETDAKWRGFHASFKEVADCLARIGSLLDATTTEEAA